MRRRCVTAILGALGLFLDMSGGHASNLPPLRCGLVRGSGTTCQWASGGACTWDKGGTPTACEPLTGGAIRLRIAGRYRGGFFNASASASVAYDARTERMFVANAATQTIDVVDLRGTAVNPDRPSRLAKLFSIDVAALLPALSPDLSRVPAPHGAATPRHLAMRSDGLLAVVLQNVQDPTLRGRVVLYRARSGPGTAPVAVLDTGFMPARAAFTPDDRRLLVANEGEPSDNYLTDPPGLVTIIDLRHGARHAIPVNVDFKAFNRLKPQLLRRGVRVTGPNLATTDPTDTASVASDVEPSDIAVAPDSRTAWVTLPESNSVALLDVRHAGFLAIMPFGTKNHSAPGNGLDPTDNDRDQAVTLAIPGLNIQTWPFSGMYMSRRVALVTERGMTLLIYPSEGLRRNFTAFKDEIRLDDPALLLDAVAFPPEAQRRLRALRLKISRVDGDRDGDGDLDRIYSFGGRSFSIRLPNNRLVYDSGDDFERITAQAMRDTYGVLFSGQPYFLFNAPDDENSFDQTSDLRGLEPISVTTGTIDRRIYAFIGLERVGGIMTYDITNPLHPRFVYYINDRNFALDPKIVCVKHAPETEDCANVGDLSPEDLVFVPKRYSPSGKPLLLVSNATSGSATVLEIDAGERH